MQFHRMIGYRLRKQTTAEASDRLPKLTKTPR
jgi:hypothetical protein